MAENDRFNWRPAVYLTSATATIGLVAAISDTFTLFFFVAFLMGGSILLALLFRQILKKNPRRTLSLAITLVVHIAVTFILAHYAFSIRSRARWLLWSDRYQAEVRGTSRGANGQFQHIDWDGWGFAGAGYTYVYLVFDPNDSLEEAARTQRAGRFTGIPCEVSTVNRLERNWYAVMLYTDQTWTQCE